MSKRNNEGKSIDNTYGGVRYRFSYDDSRRAAAVRLIRQNKRSSRSFWLTVGVVTVFCFTIAGITIVYRGIGDDSIVSTEDAQGVGGAVAVNAHVCSGNGKSYPGCFSVSDMTERAGQTYHIPCGVMVSEVYAQLHPENSDLIFYGDIITAVDGVETPDITAFEGQFASSDKRSVRLSIFREGKHIKLDYVIRNDK